ncbi:hypothetical protein AKJ62_04185 [candidate division MSBL1 archaeon SCGC-AAA259D14]|uniref:Uncharacterized protein n=2 Tax=candidate division MSBL1 TaxID=215777 RepID=A0A133UTJ4_9EURY|nr:hypothetical protein AKJ62_04185 [candidate division MSBL1 archaeon SCGC-AAA259D14]KXA97518.1 hypothetical protein AKJ38_00975 [candidate division MSBL1 archaeon SCGC-AAA259I14]
MNRDRSLTVLGVFLAAGGVLYSAAVAMWAVIGFYGGYVLSRVLIGMILFVIGMAILVRGPGIEGAKWVWSGDRASFLAVMASWVAIFILFRIYPTGILALNALAYLLGFFVLFSLFVCFGGRLAKTWRDPDADE